MKNKKIMSSFLAAMVLVSAFSMNAMAATGSNKGESKEQAVKVTYVSNQADTVYDVDIEIGDMDFNYVAASKGTWNSETHQYEGAKAAEWNYNGKNKISVTNHSEAAVNVTLAYSASEGYEEVTGTYTTSSMTLPTAVGTTFANAPKFESELNLSGDMPENSNASVTQIGTVTVTVSH